jgi:ubiquitin carboxyl-terminal hydrolase 8
MLWQESYTFLSPITFRVSPRKGYPGFSRVTDEAVPTNQKSISTFAPTFAGTEQQDSQEFLSFLLDGLHEDLNRVKQRPPPVEMTPEREAALETLPPSVAAAKEWSIYKQRNNSFVVDLFQGQYRNRLECMTCHKVGWLLQYSVTEWLTCAFRRHRLHTTVSCTSHCHFLARNPKSQSTS